MRAFKALVALAVGGAVAAAALDVSFQLGVVIAAAVIFAGGVAYGLFVGGRVVLRARRRY
jgi:hypothetical protein